MDLHLFEQTQQFNPYIYIYVYTTIHNYTVLIFQLYMVTIHDYVYAGYY
jgi:hypothetical protein